MRELSRPGRSRTLSPFRTSVGGGPPPGSRYYRGGRALPPGLGISRRLPDRSVSRVPSEPPGGPRSDPGRPRGTPPGRGGADPLSSGLPRPAPFRSRAPRSPSPPDLLEAAWRGRVPRALGASRGTSLRSRPAPRNSPRPPRGGSALIGASAAPRFPVQRGSGHFAIFRGRRRVPGEVGRQPSPVAGQEPSGSRGLRRVTPLKTSTWRGAVGTPSPMRELYRPGRSRTLSPFRTSVGGGTPSGLPLLPGRESSPSRARNLPEAAGSLRVPRALGASRGTSLRSRPAPRNSPRPRRGRSALIGASAARSFPIQSSTVPVSPRSPGGCLAGPCPACPRSLPGDLAPIPAGPAELPPAAEGQIRSHRGFRGPLLSGPELHGPRLPQISWRLPGGAVSRVPSEPPGGPRSDPGRPRGTPPGRRGADPLSSGLPRPAPFRSRAPRSPSPPDLLEAAWRGRVPRALGASRGTSLRSGPAPRNSPRPPRGRSALIGASAAPRFPVQRGSGHFAIFRGRRRVPGEVGRPPPWPGRSPRGPADSGGSLP
ncbi:basic salivary proline-rich protein 2-like [Protopterus annectens]|uniref:basic salivary proline-rich protein 2-like n=1 Tax=Protopterus annectens TaxID=7888 RepID=UPI001CFAFE5E|nr:basic salivary proline-rich protein 2-like [Protopterus annectens]